MVSMHLSWGISLFFFPSYSTVCPIANEPVIKFYKHMSQTPKSNHILSLILNNSIFYCPEKNIAKKCTLKALQKQARSGLLRAKVKKANFKGFMAIWSLWKFYIPILLLKGERFSKKNMALPPFWKLSPHIVKVSSSIINLIIFLRGFTRLLSLRKFYIPILLF